MPKKDVNPLSMIPKREDLPEGRSLKDIVNSLHPEIREPVKEVGNLAKLGYDVATGEEAEGLPFGVEMIPGVSLAAKLQQGKTPGLLDFIDIPSLKGLGALKAMPPIVGTLKELKEGGRLGKTLRNIKKAKEARNFNWDEYRDAIRYGESPWEATIQAQYVMNPDSYSMFEPIQNKKTASLGSISRATMSGDIPDSWTGKLKALSEEMAEDKSGSLRNATEKSLEELFRFYSPEDLDKSTVLEVIGKSKSPTLSRLRDLDINLRTKPGAIGRGNVELNSEPLQDYYKSLVEYGLADDWWWADPDDPADVTAVARRIKQDAGEKLRELMQNNAMYDGECYTGGTPLINPFKHLRDVSTPK